MVIIRIFVALIDAVLHVFVTSFMSLATAAASGLAVVAGGVLIALAIAGLLGFGMFRRPRK